MASAKFVLFIVGLVVSLASIIGLIRIFNLNPEFLTSFPAEAKIYFIITLFFGLIALIYSFSRPKVLT